MRKLIAVLALCSLLAPAMVLAQDAPPGIRGEILANMMDAGSKVQELAGAVPDGKFNYKPSKDVRSAGQVYLHLIGANYLFSSMIGAKPPMTMDEMYKLDTQTMEPAKIRQMLKDSYAFMSKALTDMPDSELETPVEIFGMKMTKRAMLMLAASHSHEHLGQSIAYARANNVTPPWTAREKAAAAEKKEKGGK